MTNANQKRKELTFIRNFDTPCEVVIKAWTDSKQVAIWWGPYGFTNPVYTLDVWPGSDIRIDMRGPDGVVYPVVLGSGKRLFEGVHNRLELKLVNVKTFSSNIVLLNYLSDRKTT